MELLLRDRRAILTFIGPALLVYTLVVLVPMVWSLVYTLFEGNVIAGFQFVGLHNFALLVRDPAFWQAVAFTLKYAFFVTIGQVGVGLLLALLYVFYLRNASGLVRTLIFFPVILPTVAVAQMYSKLFAIVPQLGLVNSLQTLRRTACRRELIRTSLGTIAKSFEDICATATRGGVEWKNI